MELAQRRQGAAARVNTFRHIFLLVYVRLLIIIDRLRVTLAAVEHLLLLFHVLTFKWHELLFQIKARPLRLLGEVDVVDLDRIIDLDLRATLGGDIPRARLVRGHLIIRARLGADPLLVQGPGDDTRMLLGRYHFRILRPRLNASLPPVRIVLQSLHIVP